jgi:ferric-dicitrate binding protein FerR (iron transport regulator)
MTDRFTFLLDQYLANNASAEEQAELMQMIKSGSYDLLLKQKIDHALAEGSPSSDMPAEKTQKLLNKILHIEQQTAGLLPGRHSSIRKKILSAAAVFILLVAGGWWFFLAGNNNMHDNTRSLNDQEKISLMEKHGRQFIHLPDGSSVLLNKESRLSYPESFTGKIREVTLSGEGYFDIKHNTKPFIVHTGNISVTVLGTAFNIKAYPQEDKVTITVTRGKVRVNDQGKNYGIVAPDQQMAINTKDQSFIQTQVNAEKTIAWKQQYLILDDLNMEEAAVLIGHKYHVHILLADDTLKHYRISATFLNNENLDQVLTVVCGVINAGYTLQPNDQVIITNKENNRH